MTHKLLSANNYFYLRGGAEKVFFDHNQLFEDIGWQVAPFAMQSKKNFPSMWSEYFIKEIEFGENYSPIRKVKNAKIPTD